MSEIPTPYIGIPIDDFPGLPNPFDALDNAGVDLPFDLPSLAVLETLNDNLGEVLKALLATALQPAVVAAVIAYFADLETQANGKLKGIPPNIREVLAPHYDINLDDVKVASNINTRHGRPITVKNHIYYPDNFDFEKAEIVNTGRGLIHELEHVTQYHVAGGIAEFVVKYASQAAIEILQNPDKGFDVHSSIQFEEDANNKATSIASAVATQL